MELHREERRENGEEEVSCLTAILNEQSAPTLIPCQPHPPLSPTPINTRKRKKRSGKAVHKAKMQKLYRSEDGQLDPLHLPWNVEFRFVIPGLAFKAGVEGFVYAFNGSGEVKVVVKSCNMTREEMLCLGKVVGSDVYAATKSLKPSEQGIVYYNPAIDFKVFQHLERDVMNCLPEYPVLDEYDIVELTDYRDPVVPGKIPMEIFYSRDKVFEYAFKVLYGLADFIYVGGSSFSKRNRAVENLYCNMVKHAHGYFYMNAVAIAYETEDAVKDEDLMLNYAKWHCAPKLLNKSIISRSFTGGGYVYVVFFFKGDTQFMCCVDN